MCYCFRLQDELFILSYGQMMAVCTMFTSCAKIHVSLAASVVSFIQLVSKDFIYGNSPQESSSNEMQGHF